MIIECAWEHNGDGSLLYASSVVGAFTRSSSKEEAIGKMPREINSFFSCAVKMRLLQLNIAVQRDFNCLPL
jgi:hypothetical protein